MRTFEEIKHTIETGLGQHPCSLRIENVQLVNTFSGEIYPTCIHIQDKRIVSIDPDIRLDSLEVIDGQGQYAMPGFIDSHMHFETTMLSPEALSSVVVPQGTTTLCADLMEIANVAGEDGFRTMLAGAANLPCRLLLEVSSRVPTAPGLETTGAILDAEAVARIMDWDQSISLGELDPSKILFVKDEYIHKVADTLARRKVVNGHAIGRLGQPLNVYASAGISDDHECVTTQELIARLRTGMKVLVREGSTERNLDALIQGAIEANAPLEHLCFCTDDKHPDEIYKEGHINYNIRRSIELGLTPVQAVQIATLNAAKHFRMEDELGSITPGRLADIVLVPDLEAVNPSMVLFEGKVVAEKGTLKQEVPVPAYPDWIKDTVHLKRAVTAQDFQVHAKGAKEQVDATVIGLIPMQIINERLQCKLPVCDGLVQNDLENDILKLAVVERYGKSGGIGVGFVKGFQLPKGALAFSTSHDHHNIVVVGASDEDMALAVNDLAEIHGGVTAVCDGKVVAHMSLPIGGLMSDLPADQVAEKLEKVNEAVAQMGYPHPAPFMTLSFISLPTVPELGLTDLGLIDVENHCLIDVINPNSQ